MVASLNGRYDEWNSLSDQDYEKEKQRIIEESLDSLERFIPDIRSKVEHVEAATPRTIEHYTRHQTSFGTKFEGLGCSMDLPNQLSGLYHAGSVGIIMWAGLAGCHTKTLVTVKSDVNFKRSCQQCAWP